MNASGISHMLFAHALKYKLICRLSTYDMHCALKINIAPDDLWALGRRHDSSRHSTSSPAA